MDHKPSFICLVLFVCISALSCKDDETSPAVSIQSITPSQGEIGDTITIEGANFHPTTEGNTVEFNKGIEAIVIEATSKKITTIVPVGAVSGQLSVETNGMKALSPELFFITTDIYCLPSPTTTLTNSAPRLGWTQFKFPDNYNPVLHNDFNGIDDPAAGTSDTHYYELTASKTAVFFSGQEYELDLAQSIWKWTAVDAYFKAWIDYDGDGLFEASEIIAATTTPSKEFQHFGFTVPENSSGKSGRIRIIISDQAIDDPCLIPEHGEVVDYSMSIE